MRRRKRTRSWMRMMRKTTCFGCASVSFSPFLGFALFSRLCYHVSRSSSSPWSLLGLTLSKDHVITRSKRRWLKMSRYTPLKITLICNCSLSFC
uniref:Uncharacterized protein n=1 Tax=Anguilla anguilla TaxID=7936 RepID=A0A0E9W698_ANGAN